MKSFIFHSHFNRVIFIIVLRSFIEILQGKVKVPLRDVVADTTDSTLAVSCLAYLVAAFASEPSVNHMDFTHR